MHSVDCKLRLISRVHAVSPAQHTHLTERLSAPINRRKMLNIYFFSAFFLYMGLLVWRGGCGRNSCAGWGVLSSSGIGWGGQTGSVAFPHLSLTLGENYNTHPPPQPHLRAICTQPGSLVRTLPLTLPHPNREFRCQLYIRIEN